MTIKTGCSSSLVSLDLACKALRDGDCEGALVGGTSLIFSPTMSLALSDQGVLSPTGTCKTFDASADGYGRGEAINAIYIKTLRQAIQDGDPIRAVIRGTSVNCDGQTQGMLTPSPTAQEALMRRAYEMAGITDLGQTAMIECHGTGTSVGDPLETTAVAKCFGETGIIITSVWTGLCAFKRNHWETDQDLCGPGQTQCRPLRGGGRLDESHKRSFGTGTPSSAA